MGRRGRNSAGLAEVTPARSAARGSAQAPQRLNTPRPLAAGRPPNRRWRWLAWSAVGLPLAGFTFLLAIAPSTPRRAATPPDAPAAGLDPVTATSDTFRYLPDQEVYALDFDPRKVRFDLFEGWDREQDAYADASGLAYVSGPMYERHYEADGSEVTVPLGDIKFGNQIWRGRNRSASQQRAYIGITRDGTVEFSYGELTEERARRYETFIGGLHALYNDFEQPPSGYKGAYSVSMGQRIRYYLPRIRMVMGLRSDGRLEVFMSRDGLTLEQTKELARARGLVAAYMPDHASKSRFIIPGTKGFTEEDANWISGGATSFVHVPYMLKLERRSYDLQGSLLANLNPLNREEGCSNPINCSLQLGNKVADRALAGLNRLMEQGVVPLARLVWSPTQGPAPTRPAAKAPLREPPITADPTAALTAAPPPSAPQLQRDDTAAVRPVLPAPLPPDLPEPETFDDSIDPFAGDDQTLAPVYDPELSITVGSDNPRVPEPPILPPASPPPAQDWNEPSDLPFLR